MHNTITRIAMHDSQVFAVAFYYYLRYSCHTNTNTNICDSIKDSLYDSLCDSLYDSLCDSIWMDVDVDANALFMSV